MENKTSVVVQRACCDLSDLQYFLWLMQGMATAEFRKVNSLLMGVQVSRWKSEAEERGASDFSSR